MCGARRRPPSRATAPSRRATDPPAIRLADSDSDPDSDTASDSDVWPAGEYARFQPRTAEFQRAVGEDVRGALEAALARHSALTQGDWIRVPFAGRDFELLVQKTRPGKAVSVIGPSQVPDSAAMNAVASKLAGENAPYPTCSEEDIRWQALC